AVEERVIVRQRWFTGWWVRQTRASRGPSPHEHPVAPGKGSNERRPVTIPRSFPGHFPYSSSPKMTHRIDSARISSGRVNQLTHRKIDVSEIHTILVGWRSSIRARSQVLSSSRPFAVEPRA